VKGKVEISKDILDAILNDIASGKPIKASIELYCGYWEFMKYLNSHPDAENEYATAQLAKAEAAVDEIFDIADTELDPHRARVRTEIRKWYGEKINSKKYGNRVDVNLNQRVDMSAALVDARNRALAIRDLSGTIDAQVLETKQIVDDSLGDSESLDVDDLTKTK
jgi:hypothetical protein